jgi:hypothetical protein
VKKILSSMLLTSLMFFSVACGESESDSGPTNVSDINLDPLEAELIIPETAEPQETVTLQTKVTQGEEIVDDASEVIFEVWIDGEKSDSDMIEADLPGVDGLYEVTYEFTEEALYKVQPHVTARGSHVMPVGDVIVGDVEVEEEIHEANSNEQTHDEGENSVSHDHLDESLTLDWKTMDSVSVNEEVTLSVEIQWNDDPWVQGDVRFEIWKHGDEIRQWIDGEEVEDGHYESLHLFSDEGDYHVMVHLEDDEIHEHVQYMLLVE